MPEERGLQDISENRKRRGGTEVTCCGAEHSIHADQRLERLDHRRLSDVYRDEDEVERNEDAVEPRSRPTDPSRQQGTRVLSRADIGTEEESNNSLKGSGQIVGKRGGTANPFRFWRGNAVPLAYTMTATYNTSNRKKCALNA